MGDYKEYLESIDKERYHEGESRWQEGEYTVTRTTHWSAPGCHVGCGVLLYSKNGRLVKVEGDPLNPVNNGKLCMRCLNLVEAANHPDRLKWPLKRVGERGENKWERISWDEALDIIEEKVKYIKENYGGESIVGVHGTGRNINWQLPFFYHAAFDTPNVGTMFFSGFACYLPRIVSCTAVHGDFAIVDASMAHEDRYANKDWVAPKVIVIWGTDPLKANADGFLGHWLMQCMQYGSKFITIDPRLTWTGAKSEYWLPIRPGTDAAMALGWLNVIINEDLYDHEFVEKWCDCFDMLKERADQYPVEKVAEICGVPAELIRAAARLYATNSPAAIQTGLALDQQIGAMQAATAISAIYSICGNLDIPGGQLIVRYAFNTTEHYNCGEDFMTPGQIEKKLTYGSSEKALELGTKTDKSSAASSDTILETCESGKPYPIKMMWIQSSNTIACPSQHADRCYNALKNVDFIVVADPFMTPTAVAVADLVLPVAMSCERNSIRAWWSPILAITKACDTFYECKTDEEIAALVANRIRPGEFPFKTDIEILEWYIGLKGDYPGTWKDLSNEVYRYWYWNATYKKYEKGMLREDGQPGFKTLTGKVELAPSMAVLWNEEDILPKHIEPPESPISTPELAKEYPLIFTNGGRSYEFFHSEHRQLPTMREFHPWPLIWIHPETAEKYGIKDGDWVWAENMRGRMKQKAYITEAIRKDTVHAEHGWWFPEQDPAVPSLFGTFDSNPNNLTASTTVGDNGWGSPIKSTICKIYPVTPENDSISPTEQITKFGGFQHGK
ncbi:MAG: molybdopterin-dependent oxidoreductase [Peptococcaceae bacterium]|nr:molybdopterin-dependent oxidoreductase [Peptococcaceae bacterium]